MRNIPISRIRQRLSELFSPIPEAESEAFGKVAGHLLRARHLLAYDWALPFVVGKDVLEIGVDHASGSQILASETASFTGVGFSHDLALQAHRDTGVNVVQANGQKLPFPDESFDVIVTFDVIEHVWDAQAYLNEVSRVLRSGGVLLVSTPQAKSRLHMGQTTWNDVRLREYDEGSWAVTLKAAFEQVTSYGLFANDVADRIERRRVWQDPWQYFFGGPWAGPIRRLGRLISSMRKDSLTVAPSILQTVLDDKDEALLGHFYFDINQLEGALDLFAVCSKSGGAGASSDEFDAINYWKNRIKDRPTLQGTGTSGAPLAWQQWLYHGKERAYRRLLKQHQVDLVGKRVLDFGCGTGYFEDVWERWGSSQTCGIDIVPEVIAKLEREYPKRKYLCADIVGEHPDLSIFGKPDMVTAIDVLYHVVDDEKLLPVLKSLVSILPEDGYFLLTDAMHENFQTNAHVRFRSLNQWKQILSLLGMEIVGVEPVFAVNNRPKGLAYRFPSFYGALQHYIDLPVLRTMPRMANNWVLLARRH